MINGLEGIPGSGKSYEAVVYHVLAALMTGRKVITNLPLNVELFGAIDPSYPALIEIRTRSRPVLGTWDANNVDEKGNGNAFIVGQFPPDPPATSVNPRAGISSAPVDYPVFGQVWDYYDTWRHADGRGPLFVIDECHVPLPDRSGGIIDPHVVQWFKLHRHFNVDVLLMTQSFRDINQPIARLMAILVKVRSADILGKKDSYIRKTHAGYRGAVINTEERKYLPQYFPLYKSHTQGRSVAESAAQDVKPFLVKFKRFSYFFYAFAAIFFIYAFWPSSKPDPLVKPPVLKDPVDFPPRLRRIVSSPAPAVPSSAPSLPSSSPQSSSDPRPDLLSGKLIHITGWMRLGSKIVHTFTVSLAGQRVFDLLESDLVVAGYSWKPLGECMGYLVFAGATRAVTCDAPALAAGTQRVPVVISDGSRRSSLDGLPGQPVQPGQAGQAPALAPGPGSVHIKL